MLWIVLLGIQHGLTQLRITIKFFWYLFVFAGFRYTMFFHQLTNLTVWIWSISRF